MQLIPEATTFASGSDPLADWPQLYASVLPWSGIGIQVNTGTMADQDGTATFCPFTAETRTMGWAAFVGLDVADCSVEAFPRLHLLLGALDADAFAGFGVGARLQGGGWNDVGDSNGYWGTPDGYYFVHRREAATVDWLVLLKITSGSVVTLAAQQIEPSPGESFVFPRPMRIECEGNEIRCFREIEGPFTPNQDTVPAGVAVSTYAGPGTPVFTVTDSQSDAITTSGRAAFGCMSPTEISGSKASVSVQRFSVLDGAGDPLLDDAFDRAAPLAARLVTDSLGRTGRSVMQAFSGDYQGRQDEPAYYSNLDQQIPSGVTRGALVNLNGQDQGFGWHLSQIPSNNADQSRKLRFLFDGSDASNGRKVGLLARGSFSGPLFELESDGELTGWRGYLCEVVWEQGATDPLLLRLLDYTGSPVDPKVLATAPLAGTALGVEHTLDFGVAGATSIRVLFDGAEVTAWTGLAKGLTLQGSVITDGRSAKHSTGAMVGFRFEADSHAPDLIEIRAFEDGSEVPLVSEAGAVNIHQIPNYPVPREDYNHAAERFKIEAGYPIQVTDGRESISQRVRSGHTIKIPEGNRSRRVWTLNLAGRPWFELLYIQTFAERRRGGEQPFYWIEPTEQTQVSVRFASDTIETLRKVIGGNAATIRLEEVHRYG